MASESVRNADRIDFLSSIPPPIIRMLTHLSPIARFITGLVHIVTWHPTTPASHSLLLLIAWWTLCLYHRIICIIILPLLPISRLVYQWLLRQRREYRGKPHPDTKDTPPDVSQAVKDLEYLLMQLDKTNDFFNLIFYQLDWHNPQVSLCTLRNLLCLYPAWIVCAYILPVRHTLIGLGTLSLLWNSPWAIVIRSAVYEYPLAHRIMQATYDTWHSQRASNKRRKSEDGWRAIQSQSAKSGRRPEKELMFRFVVYENQRWWPGVAWNDVLLPNERPSWADEYHEPVPKTKDFSLPPPSSATTKLSENSMEVMRKSMQWVWSDPEWWLDLDGDVDKEGWEYGNHSWENMTNKSTGLAILTRRRRWVKTAKLEEHIDMVVDDDLPVPDTSSMRSFRPSSPLKKRHTSSSSSSLKGSFSSNDSGVSIASCSSSPKHVRRQLSNSSSLSWRSLVRT
ncbi:Tectonin beta-propeller repeat-containing protein 1 [Umbelopsis sp. WA50703]